MAATNINRVILTGNLTKDPELRATGSGLAVCSLRVACNTRRKDGDQWVDKPNYFDVTIFGKQGENASQYLSKGRAVAVDGRLEWREFTDSQGNKRQATEIVADNVQFLSSPDGGQGNGGGGGNGFSPRSDIPVSQDDFAPVGGGGPSAPADDDIPF